MGGSQKTAKRGNAIAQASLREQKRQYAEQKAKEQKREAAAKANAGGVRRSSNMSYANNYNQSTDFGINPEGGYSLLTAGGTPSVIGDLLSGNDTNNTLG